MDQKYQEWIRSSYPTKESASYKCKQASEALRIQFPELIIKRGHAMVRTQYRPHWWCETKAGTIIDPTAHQWDSIPAFYDPIKENDPEPIGKCIDCGDLIFEGDGNQYLHDHCSFAL